MHKELKDFVLAIVIAGIFTIFYRGMHFNREKLSVKTIALGFTLIELVLVLVILGILVSTVSQKFISVQTEATEASLKQVYGSMKTAINEIHAKAIVSSKDNGVHTITINGQALEINNGYPRIVGADTLAVMNSKFKLWFNIDSTDYYTAQNNSSFPFFISKASGSNTLYIYPKNQIDNIANDDCRITYRNNTTLQLLISVTDCE